MGDYDEEYDGTYLWRKALPPADCAAIIQALPPHDPVGVRLSFPLEDLAVPELFLLTVAEVLGLECEPDNIHASVGAYGPGVGIVGHVDEDAAVAFSVLLNDDFTGGWLQVNGGIVEDLGVGDLVAWNGRLVHEVLPVESGTRYVLVGWVEPGGDFLELSEWSDEELHDARRLGYTPAVGELVERARD